MKFHSRLRTIPHLIHIHTTHMSNVQWMPYSFVRLYLFKYDVCVLNYIWIKPKRFWSFYMFLEVIFITLCVYVLCLLCFSLFMHVLCWKTSVRIFGYSFWLLSRVANFGYSIWRPAQLWNPSRKFIQKLLRLTCNLPATCKNFRDSSHDSLVARLPKTAF